jgi:hypothetical protein
MERYTEDGDTCMTAAASYFIVSSYLLLIFDVSLSMMSLAVDDGAFFIHCSKFSCETKMPHIHTSIMFTRLYTSKILCRQSVNISQHT